ncbi:hypothetical protein LOTGIDRAFT_162009 [Lottia gigantea]|uniref:Uncharacterized protein n=1 Tax=Lottia gigantea TaxID=225164 RepID=V3ZNN6_LOTGI|nr:hypothetical protein LOTGIDRAFT_162009 [Lottia gigantea]ESO92983.1 hypothetical protein LOTGIDRAFT_162009 [Lottia gigantea]
MALQLTLVVLLAVQATYIQVEQLKELTELAANDKHVLALAELMSMELSIQYCLHKECSKTLSNHITEKDIVAAHTLPSKYANKPKPIIVKFRSEVKRNIMMKRKDLFKCNISVFDDITKSTQT